MGKRGPKKRILNDAEFWGNVANQDQPKACWPWKGKTDKQGRGLYRSNIPGIGDYVHRIAYYLTHNEKFGKTAILKHYCGNKSCCNPDHMYVSQHHIENYLSGKTLPPQRPRTLIA